MAKRAIIIVLDGCGVGEAPDAAEFGDTGSNTLGNLSRAFEDGLHLPNLGKLGLGNIIPLRGVPPDPAASAAWGKCTEKSRGKDTTSGHWEIAGCISHTAFPTYPKGFPPEIVDAFEARIGRKILANYPASGTEIIKELGEEHMSTGRPIVYTSADSVFQIAAHEKVVSVQQLYEWCTIAREILQPPHQVGRVIARPFVGEPGKFKRSSNRKDYSIEPSTPTILDIMKENELSVVGVGKIGDIFAHRGLTQEIHTSDNREGILATLMQMNEASDGLIFTNLVDTDAIYGHRNDTAGFRAALEYFDGFVPNLIKALHPEDLLIVTADHGVDPTTPSTDHSREYTPLLAIQRGRRPPVNLGTRQTYADIAETILEMFNLPTLSVGTSFYKEIQ